MQGESEAVTVQIPTQDIAGRNRKQKCVSCFKKFIAFLFSTIGLSCLMVGYTIFGGFIFMKLEAPNEESLRNNMQKNRRITVETLWNITIEMNVFYEPNWTRKADELLKNYTDQVYFAIEKEGWDGKHDSTDHELQWSFPGAMLYSITVVTTIGYGHITPKTPWGRLVTILYAIVGIPLTLLTITNLGGFMATAFRFMYQNICCGLFCVCCSKPKSKKPATNNLRYDDVTNAGETGVALTSEDPEIGCGHNGETIDTIDRSLRRPPNTVRHSNISWRHGVTRALKTDDNRNVRVPIYISLLTITGYIMAGALLFTLWEADWNIFVGAYFCFITLTTIGFGDYVPGTSLNSWDSQQKLVLCALWLIIGLALIAMCFDLMQEEVRNKCRTLGQKLGILTDDGRQAKKDKKKSRRKSKAKRSNKSKRKKLKDSKKEQSEKDKDNLVDIYEKDENKDIKILSKIDNPSLDNVWVEAESPWIKRDTSSCSWPRKDNAFVTEEGHSHGSITPQLLKSQQNSHNDLKPMPGGSSSSLQKEGSVVFTVDIDNDGPPVILTRYPAYNSVNNDLDKEGSEYPAYSTVDRDSSTKDPPTYNSVIIHNNENNEEPIGETSYLV